MRYHCENVAAVSSIAAGVRFERRKVAWLLWMSCVLALLPLETAASWIDPETPEEAFRTQSFVPSVPRPPKKDKVEKHSNATHRRHRAHTPFPSESPSQAPTSTIPPTEVPSSSPSMFPTATPGSFELVFSDEFNTPFRTFEDGVDPRWTALDKNDYTNDALHYYAPQNAVTNQDGELVITTEAADTDVVGFDDVNRKKTRVTKHFRSAMIQSWNKFCFTGGIVEIKAKLPGKSSIGGLWPAFWLLGNLARHTYVGSSEHIWPWSSTVCTKKSQDAQLINACKHGVHWGMHREMGRGAPEMDIFEVQPGNIKANTGVFLESIVGQPFMSASYQVAPGRPANRPGPGHWPGPGQWYEGLVGGNRTNPNILFYGNYNFFRSDVHPATQSYWSDAISYNRQLDEDHFEKPHIYRLEWDVPTDEKQGYLHWFLDGELVLAINGESLTKAGLGSSISSEPSYMILNTAVSSQWGFPKKCPDTCTCKKFDCRGTDWQSTCGFSEGFCDMMKNEPPEYKVDWIRVYQNPNFPEQKVGCSTPERPTRRYIEAHESMYKTEHDVKPLKGTTRGAGTCDPKAQGNIPQACGGSERGRCTVGRVCECKAGWTGPHCLANEGSDPIVYDAPDSIADIGFQPPAVAPLGLFVGFTVLALLLGAAVVRSRKYNDWTPIPNAHVEYRRL